MLLYVISRGKAIVDVGSAAKTAVTKKQLAFRLRPYYIRNIYKINDESGSFVPTGLMYQQPKGTVGIN